LNLSQAFDEITISSSNISKELQRLVGLRATMSLDNNNEDADMVKEAESCSGFLHRESFSTEIIESISAEDLHRR
jgi:hypothetical protein